MQKRTVRLRRTVHTYSNPSAQSGVTGPHLGSGVSRLCYFLQGFGKDGYGLIDLLFGDNQRGLEADYVAAAANADEHAIFEAEIADGFGFRGCGSFLHVFDKFDADHQAQAADITDERIGFCEIS